MNDFLFYQLYWFIWAFALHVLMRRFRPAPWMHKALFAGPLVALLPFALPSTPVPEIMTVTLPEITVGQVTSWAGQAPDFNWWIPYALIVLAMLSLHVFRFIQVRNLFAHAPKEKHDGYTIITLDDDRPTTAFTFWRWVFLPKGLTPELRACILEHELVHVRKRHSLELSFALFLNALFWFNPASWWMRADLKTYHEVVADAVAIRRFRGETYLNALLSSNFGLKHIAAIVHPFHHVKLKTRIVMLNREKSPRMLLVIPAMLVGAMLFVQSCAKSEDNLVGTTQSPPPPPPPPEPKEGATVVNGQEVIEVAIDRQAEYPGGMQALMTYVAENLEYPASAKDAAVQGKVMVQFTVASDGSVTDPTVVKSLNEACDAAALAVFEDMPDWEPSVKDGQTVATQMVLPIMFALD
jgi:TonB family protein